jgi:hypothetical protein
MTVVLSDIVLADCETDFIWYVREYALDMFVSVRLICSWAWDQIPYDFSPMRHPHLKIDEVLNVHYSEDP